MTFQSYTTFTAKKRHRCEHCRGDILPGARYIRAVGVHDGQFYAGKLHLDCNAMWNEAYRIYADYSEGMPWDLLEAICGDEGRQYQLAELNTWRGQYPHVVCRLELRMQKSDIRAIDRHRADGFDPDLEPWEELHS